MSYIVYVIRPIERTSLSWLTQTHILYIYSGNLLKAMWMLLNRGKCQVLNEIARRTIRNPSEHRSCIFGTLYHWLCRARAVSALQQATQPLTSLKSVTNLSVIYVFQNTCLEVRRSNGLLIFEHKIPVAASITLAFFVAVIWRSISTASSWETLYWRR